MGFKFIHEWFDKNLFGQTLVCYEQEELAFNESMNDVYIYCFILAFFIFLKSTLFHSCFCSEPAGETCNRKAEASNKTDWLTIIVILVIFQKSLTKLYKPNWYPAL